MKTPKPFQKPMILSLTPTLILATYSLHLELEKIHMT